MDFPSDPGPPRTGASGSGDGPAGGSGVGPDSSSGPHGADHGPVSFRQDGVKVQQLDALRVARLHCLSRLNRRSNGLGNAGEAIVTKPMLSIGR